MEQGAKNVNLLVIGHCFWMVLRITSSIPSVVTSPCYYKKYMHPTALHILHEHGENGKILTNRIV